VLSFITGDSGKYAPLDLPAPQSAVASVTMFTMAAKTKCFRPQVEYRMQRLPVHPNIRWLIFAAVVDKACDETTKR
jgi:hypothetical protein